VTGGTEVRFSKSARFIRGGGEGGGVKEGSTKKGAKMYLLKYPQASRSAVLPMKRRFQGGGVRGERKKTHLRGVIGKRWKSCILKRPLLFQYEGGITEASKRRRGAPPSRSVME